MELLGTDLIEVPHGTPLVFTHPACPGPLRIYGANAIQWAYQLITRSQQTYGGEVVQVLGAFVAPIQITGNSLSKTHYEVIRRWFLTYMTAAGLTRRDQEPILFTYAERGWSFNIQVTDMPWSIAHDVIADEWAITAEIVSDNSRNDLAYATMSSYTFQPDFINKFGDIGFTPATEDQFDSGTLGDNFNRLLASWVTGEYETFGFQSNADPNFNFESETKDFYTNAFGTEFIVPPSNSGGDATAYTGGEPASKLQIVALIASSFEAADMPARLGVAVAILESGLDADIRNSIGYMGLFQTQPGPTGKSEANVREARLAAQHAPAPVTNDYPASMQIAHAASWFKTAAPDRHSKTTPSDDDALLKWAMRAQGVNLDNNPLFGDLPKFLREADKLIKEAEETNAGSGSAEVKGVTLTGEALSKAILNHKNFTGTDNDAARSDIANYKSVGLNEVVVKGIYAILEAGWTLHISSVKTNRGGANHGPGRAFDANNYGPGGAHSGGPGTSSADPTKFITFLKANRKALGGLRVGYGSPSAGADFADKTDHVHVDWNGSV